MPVMAPANATRASCAEPRTRASASRARSDRRREVQKHEACEQHRERTDAALPLVVIRPVRPGLIRCAVVRARPHRSRTSRRERAPRRRRPDSASSRCHESGSEFADCSADTWLVMPSRSRASSGERSVSPSGSPRSRSRCRGTLPDELRDRTRTCTVPLCVPPVEQHADVGEEEKRPTDQSEPGHAARDEAGAVHQVAEDQSVPQRNDIRGRSRNVQSLSAASEKASVVPHSGESCRKLTTPSTKMIPRRDEDALDDSRSDVADGEGLVLPPRDRVEDDSRSDVRRRRGRTPGRRPGRSGCPSRRR